ncbi:MAG: chromate efflux transporter [Niabella sp.]|nr:chromate efflux transporter [Niabella sp.]
MSNAYLFATFFKVGLFSFGGNMALVSMVQKKLVEDDKVLDNSRLLEALSIAALLPGPMAVNVVAYIGYCFKGKRGAALSMLGVLLTAFLLMLFLSWLYYNSAVKPFFAGAMVYVIGAVCAIILSTGAALYKKEVAGDYKRMVICIAAMAGFFFGGNSYAINLLFIALAGTLGVLLKLDATTGGGVNTATEKSKPSPKFISFIVLFLATVQLFFSAGWYRQVGNIYLKLVLIFSGLSLTLFGGGYVMIPAMQSLFVNDLQWLSRQEFVDAIAFSQLTPGPIMVSAVFIGFKMAGLSGALLACLAMFVPPAMVMLLLSHYLNKSRHKAGFRSAMAGIKIVVIAMIIVSAFRLFPFSDFNVAAGAIFLISFVLNYFFKVNPFYIVLGTILISSAYVFLG